MSKNIKNIFLITKMSKNKKDKKYFCLENFMLVDSRLKSP